MRAAIIAMISFALVACESHSGGGAADAGPADTATSDRADVAGTDGGITSCNGEAPCYSSDCTTILSCNDTGGCPGGQLYWGQCFGPDASRDGAADR